MKKLLFTCLAVTGMAGSILAQTWKIDHTHTNINFSVDYMLVSELEGSFKKYDGKALSAKNDFTDLKIDFTVDVNSIDTDNEMRDKHLKGEDFFAAEKYPAITFKSVSMKKTGDKKYVLEGDLTIRDVTRRVKFDVKHGGIVNDPFGNTKAGFKATTVINRQDYGLKYNAALESGDMVASNEVTIDINAILIKQK